MNRCGIIILLMAALSATGCVVVDIGVTNPNPSISTGAVAPFFNQSAEKTVDGRRFAQAYFTELQKTPGYQVVPVGVTETAIIKHHLKMASPQDVLRLAEILNVDAVVVGTVTEYVPYYPPRIGMHVEWYSPRPVNFEPGIQIDPNVRKQIRHSILYEDSNPEFHRRRRKLLSKVPLVLRGQSPSAPENNRFSQYQQNNDQNKTELTGVIEEAGDGLIQPYTSYRNLSRNRAPTSKWFGYTNTNTTYNNRVRNFRKSSQIQEHPQKLSPPKQKRVENPPLKRFRFPKIKLAGFSNKVLPPSPNPFLPKTQSKTEKTKEKPEKKKVEKRQKQGDKTAKVTTNTDFSPAVIPAPPVVPAPFVPIPTLPADPIISSPALAVQQTPLKPIMSYTRIFEGSDADLTATLRNYLELNGDARSGNWEATMQRSEDFIRFTCHIMIREMLTLHGGEARRRIVLKYRKYK
ncbi:hypothetical protein MNBD_PLANCTO02-372 [hydrothermal vent metagenome]|uniref:Uncharacterized protein n=1 Tax=hydrothermal vent metagenome TaxID=652676 RepID=A0A3B1DW09_9ZZZZ